MQDLQLSSDVADRFPGLRERDGRTVVVGMRSGHLHPAESRPDLPSLNARVELVEALGSESIAYFKLDACTVWAGVTADDLLEEPNGEGVFSDRPNLVASCPADVRLTIQDIVPVAVDTSKLYLFDPESGAPIR